ncbi:MAG: hydroxyacid dehydrogenase [Candidatus Berkelbacteria bacterium]|nr:MAG: hydroxyacid dehydrogenase [Candidatus Berkelbacteria bacterium]QQG52016.1 MAG: hydroxyacid dehydrogenase [Candidatus Berkelbacteria bacterium]
MEGKRVVFFEVEKWEEEFFRERLHGTELVFYPHRLTPHNVPEAEGADFLVCFVYSDLKAHVLDQLRDIRGIATMSVGTNHIDMKLAHERNITVCNVPAYGPNTVAEHAIALLLALSRNIVPSVERTRDGDFDYRGLTGWDLMGKTLGVVGTGKIGAHVARIASGLGMRLMAFDPKPNDELVEKYGVEFVSLPQLLHASDVITLHCPLLANNTHVVGRDEFKQMKRGVVLINTARGGLVDTRALLEAIDDGIVSQAAVDVLEDEELLQEEKEFFSPYFQLKDYQTALADHALMRHPKVLVTPHNAFNSREALDNILETTAKNIEGMLTSDLVNVVS